MRKNLLGASVAMLIAGMASAASAVESVRSISADPYPVPTLGLKSSGGGRSSMNGGRRGRGMAAKRASKKARNVRRNRLAHRGARA